MSNFLDLDVESLESRRMLAGNVATRVTGGGDLVLNGDNADNELVVFSTSTPGDFVVRGLNGTSIDGRSEVTVRGVTDDMRIRLKRGDNAILLTHQDDLSNQRPFIVDDVSFASRSGNDIFGAIGVTIGGQLRTSTSSGDDIVAISESALGSASVQMSRGSDILVMDDSDVFGRTNVGLGSGSDVLFILDGFHQETANLKLGTGNDIGSNAGGYFEDDLRLDAGGGFDELIDPGPSDRGTVIGNREIDNFEIATLETGFDYLTAIDAAIRTHIREADFELIFSDYV